LFEDAALRLPAIPAKEREARALFTGFPPLFKPGAGSAREWRMGLYSLDACGVFAQPAFAGVAE